MYKDIVENNADFVVSGWEDFKDDKVTYRCKKFNKKLFDDEIIEYLLNEKYFASVIWSKLYKTEIISHNLFDINIKIAEDFDFLYRVLKNVKVAIINTNNVIYKYRICETSAMRAKYNSNFEKEIELSETVLNDIKKTNPKLTKYAIRRYQRINISCINKYYRENGNINGVMHLADNLKKYKINLNLKNYLKMILLLYCRPILRLIYKREKRFL